MTFRKAYQRIALAGRELGSGAWLAAERLAPSVEETLLAEVEEQWAAHEALLKRTRQEIPVRGEWLERRVQHAKTVALGVAIGLVMAENENALAELEKIHQEWRNQC